MQQYSCPPPKAAKGCSMSLTGPLQGACHPKKEGGDGPGSCQGHGGLPVVLIFPEVSRVIPCCETGHTTANTAALG